ncbi:hypothetical protein B0A52_02007 [Exophiala mesophila]|uniref:Uncharacterized protein n=1 Tax=Exophiala mesophila TaxID=212818 RepID=A0A438NEL4_EXOME|nr:hypothetical protein B0A52_02007 [Exophiala mesophila]
MVRIKHRYLLFNILYPTDVSAGPSEDGHTRICNVYPPPSATTKSAPKPTPTPPTLSSHTSNLTPTPTPTPSFITIHRPSPPHLTSQLLLSTLRHTIVHNFGDHGLAVVQAGLRVVYFSPATSTCILRCPRAQVRLVWAGLTFLDGFPGSQRGGADVACVVQVVRVSGTIRKSEEELVRRARRDIVRAKMEGWDTTGEEVDIDGKLLKGVTVGTATRGQQGRMALASNITGSDGIEDLPDEEEDDEDLDDDMSDMDE